MDLSYYAEQRKRDLESGYPARGPNGQSRFIQPPEPLDDISLLPGGRPAPAQPAGPTQPNDDSSTLLRMLSRFLRPGQQTRPAAPRQPGVNEQE